MSNSPDPGSLSLLNDIVVPEAVSWWPPAPGWYVVAILVSIALVIGAWKGWHTRQTRRYRRQAIAELHALRESQNGPRTAAAQILILLKRTALAAYPREQVAGLSGDRWWAFLDHTSGDTTFVTNLGPRIANLAYGSELQGHADDQLLDSLFKAAERWMVTHHQSGGD